MTEHLLVCSVIKLIPFSIRLRFFFFLNIHVTKKKKKKEKEIELRKYYLPMLLSQTWVFLHPENDWNELSIFKNKIWQQVASTSDQMCNKQNKWTSWNATVSSTSPFKIEMAGNSFNSPSWKMTRLYSALNMNVWKSQSGNTDTYNDVLCLQWSCLLCDAKIMPSSIQPQDHKRMGTLGGCWCFWMTTQRQRTKIRHYYWSCS